LIENEEIFSIGEDLNEIVRAFNSQKKHNSIKELVVGEDHYLSLLKK